MEKLLNNLSLLPLPPDKRDFSHSKKFGVLGIPELPDNNFSIYDQQVYRVKYGDTLSGIALKYHLTLGKILIANPDIKNANKILVGQVIKIPAPNLEMLDQYDLDFCAGYSSTEESSDLFAEVLDPYFGFAQIKRVRGEYISYGADLRDACKSLKSFGSILRSQAPYTHGTGLATDRERDFLANWKNYPSALDLTAQKYKIGSYYVVDGPYDFFDNVRMTIYQHRIERRGVVIGMNWRPEWTSALHGVIPEANYLVSSGAPHAVRYIGQKNINGKLYLILQNSWGTKFGDNGLFYFPRSVVNLEYKAGFGAFHLSRVAGSGGGIIGSLLEKLTALFN